jgi:hypothetical protein
MPHVLLIIMLNVNMLSVVMLIVVMLSAIMLRVVTPKQGSMQLVPRARIVKVLGVNIENFFQKKLTRKVFKKLIKYLIRLMQTSIKI